MFKFFWTKQPHSQTDTKADWQHDPSGHPALLQMSARELADMPMVPEEVPFQLHEAQSRVAIRRNERHGNACTA